MTLLLVFWFVSQGIVTSTDADEKAYMVQAVYDTYDLEYVDALEPPASPSPPISASAPAPASATQPTKLCRLIFIGTSCYALEHLLSITSGIYVYVL